MECDYPMDGRWACQMDQMVLRDRVDAALCVGCVSEQELVDEARLFETAATGGEPVLVAHKVGHG